MGRATGYAGDLTPDEAFELLKRDPRAVLIDVRTEPEWERVGVPDEAGLPSAPVFLEWLLPPAMTPNPAFIDRLKNDLAPRGATEDTPLLFLCRSGARSAAAAAAVTDLGYQRCYNIAGGFEGSPAQGYPGWRQSGLPSTSP